MQEDELEYQLTTKEGKKVTVWKDRNNDLWYQVDGDGTGYPRLEDVINKCAE